MNQTKYHLLITFTDGERYEYFTNHLNIETLMNSEHLELINEIDIQLKKH